MVETLDWHIYSILELYRIKKLVIIVILIGGKYGETKGNCDYCYI